MGRGALIAGVALIVAGGGALGYGVTRTGGGGMTRERTTAMATAASSLDGDIKAARASVEQKAKTLAEVSTVRAAVGTDAPTATDMVGKEIAFKPDPGEVIELGQIPKTGGAPVSLAVLPANGMRSSQSGKTGAFAELVEDQLLVTQTAEVIPSDAGLAEQVTGFVTVTRPLDLKPAFERLVAAGLSGRIEVGDKQRVFGTPPADGSGEWMPQTIPSQPGAQLVAAVPAKSGGMSVPVVGAGAGIAGLGLILFVIGLIGSMGGKDKVTAGGTHRGMGAPHQSSVGDPRLTQQPVAAGTPSFVDPSTSASINPANLGPGALVGRWEIVRRLGSGGMADVYLAQARGEAGFEKLVAIKVMHSHLARNPRAVDHFLDEARLAARVSHPNVVAIQDLGKIGNDYVIVMDYVDGVDLERLLASARMAQRPVPLNVALGILCRICDGLHAAHKATAPDGTPLGIIHRDVKSANVLVSKQGGVKVVDFGIAKAASQAHNTMAGETKGTPSMMAPEQRVGNAVDVRADVYSVAAVAFEVVTGHGVNLDLAALAHLGVDNWPHLPPPSSLRPALPPELDGILLTAMAFDRERRPADCAAFEALIEQVMKRHNLNTSDKDIARWVESELADLKVPPAFDDATSRPSA
ncbi:MAG: serine/threonine protein kinase [Deltaproteobacteria bacterium]|nr:serine/threonine protein kinase [Deltaproteobacteria bacterium]